MAARPKDRKVLRVLRTVELSTGLQEQARALQEQARALQEQARALQEQARALQEQVQSATERQERWALQGILHRG